MNESYTKTIESKNKLIKKNDIISALIFLSLLGTPAKIQASTQTTNRQLKNTIELNETNDLLDKMNQKFWINIPSPYNEILKNFISNSATLHNKTAIEFTENFISDQMSQNRWISKENQYLFIRCTIYTTLTNWELYDWTDWDEQRYNEYENAFESFLSCEENYKTELKNIMNIELKKSRDDLQKSRDDLQKAKNNLLRTDTEWLMELIRFYNIYQKDPSLVNQEELEQVSKASKDLIKFCKRDWIDYKSVLIKEVWDRKKVDEMLKFYWVE